MRTLRHSRVGENPAFKLFYKLLTVFGITMIFTVSGFGLDECSSVTDSHAFTEASPDNYYERIYTSNSFDNNENRYFYFSVPIAGTLTFHHTSTASVAYAYNLNGCASFPTTLSDGDTIHLTSDTDFNLRLHSSANNQHYNFNFTFVADQVPPIMGNIPNQTTAVGTAFSLNLASYITLTNGDAVSAYTLTGTLPTGLDFNSSTGVISGIPTVVTASTSFTITATDNDGISNSDSFTITITPPFANLSLTNSDSIDPVSPNAPYSYTLSITNGGPDRADNLVITDTIPAGSTFQNASGTGWTCSHAAGVVTCTNPSLANGATSNVTISLLAPTSVGTVTNTATVISSATDSVAANNTNITQSTTVQLPTISINDVSIFEGPNGSTRLMTFTVSISPSASGTIDYNTSNLTATAGSDYEAKSGTITFVAGEITEREIEVKIFGDTNSAEGSETFRVTLSNSNGFTITKAIGTGTIYDYGSTVFRSGERDFELRNPQKTRNKTGDILVIGNSVQCVTDNDSSFGGNCTTNLSRTANDYYTKYLNSDSNTSTFNSANATLAGIPSGAKVIWAGLYWQGFMHDCGDGDTSTCRFRTPNYTALSDADNNINLSSNSYDTQKVYIDIPNNSINGYELVTASLLDYRYVSSANGTVYSAFSEITEMLNTANANGIYTVANIQSMEGEHGWGNFGAWSLFVIYEDLSTSAVLRNMSVYDGFKTVNSSSSASIPLSGFMTPTQGTVDSKLISFAGEGEYAYTSDRITVGGSTNYLSNTDNPENNVFNSTISGFTRNPSYANANGIDIDIFDASGYMGHGQTSTTVGITSTMDAFYPSVIGFSTQLYAPDVCYLEDISYNGLPISETNQPENGGDIEVTVMVTNKDNEPAQGVFIEKKFENPNEQLKYKSGSMSIRPIGATGFTPKTDTLYDDTAEYSSSDEMIKLLLGSGASSAIGGTIAKNQETQFKYTATIGTDENISENVYLVSYRNDYLKISFQGVPIRKCVDFNNTFGAYTPLIGKFNTVRHDAVNIAGGETDPIDPLDSKNALYTQIVNAPFSVDVIAFANDNITPTNWSGDLNLSIAELPESGLCADVNTSLSSVYPLNFNSEKYKTLQVTPTKASRNAVFKMVTSTANLCSRDRFAIRPAGYQMDANETTLIGNKMYQFNFIAHHMGANNTPSDNYNQEIHNAIDKNATTQLILPIGCTLANPVEYTNNPLPFSSGQVNGLLLYQNVGDVNFTISDNDWSKVDYLSNKGDCVIGSIANVPDGNQKIGCLTQTSKTFSFLPEKLDMTLGLANGSSNGSFTYIANEQNMSAPLTLNITAKLFGGGTATNYTSKCYAKDANVTLRLENDQTLTWSTSQNRILFHDDLNVSSTLLSTTANEALYNISEGNYTSGNAISTLRFNFNRNHTLIDNPFNIARNDFNITSIVDEMGTIGNDFVRSGDHNVTFVYGRIIPRDVRVFGNVTFNANGWYEVYNVQTLGGVSLIPSKNEAMWYINSEHIDTGDGDANVTQIQQGLTSTSSNISSNSILTGIETYGFGGQTPPYSAKAHINTDPWLWYGTNALSYSDPSSTNLDCQTHPCFNITVVPSVGATGSAKSTNESTKASKKTDSGGGTWKSTSDYAPAIR